MVMVQPAQLMRVCSSAWIEGRAVATIVCSTSTMNRPTETQAKTRPLCRPYPAGTPSGFAAGDDGPASWWRVTRAGQDRPRHGPGRAAGVAVTPPRGTGAVIGAGQPWHH